MSIQENQLFKLKNKWSRLANGKPVELMRALSSEQRRAKEGRASTHAFVTP